MNKVILSITGCALALGLVAAPVASAKTPSHTKVSAKHAAPKVKVASKHVSSKAKASKHAVHAKKATAKHVALRAKVSTKHVTLTKKVSAKHTKASTKVSAKHSATKAHVSKATVKKGAHHVSPAKLKEVQKFISPVNKNINKVDTSLQSLTQSITNFYATPATSEQELDFYNSALGKLNADSKQLTSYKKQLDHLSKKYGSADVLTSAYQKVSDLQAAITNEVTTLNGLHASFVPVASPAPAPTTSTPTTEPTTSDPTATTPTTTDPTTSDSTVSEPTSSNTTTSTPTTSSTSSADQTTGTAN